MTRDNWREVAQLAALIGALTAVGFVVTAVGAALLLTAWDRDCGDGGDW